MYANLFTDNHKTQSSLADSTTVFGDIIRQVAEQFALGQYNGKELVEYTKDNTDEWIKKLWMCYQGSVPTGNEFARSYCAVGAWLTIQTAAKIAQCSNQFPKGLSGSVLNTFNRIQNTTSIVINATPAVGSVFVRESTHSGNNHMGIVVSVGESGTTIQTIEWNAGLDQVGASTYKTRVYGGVSHVAYYPEKYNQFKFWKFLHFEDMCNISTLPCGVYTDSCFSIEIEITGCDKTIVTIDTPPDVIKKTDTSICENYTCPPGYRKLTSQELITRGATVISSKKDSTDYYNQYCCVPNNQTTVTNVGTKNPKPCPTIIKTGCDTGSIKVNYPDTVPHYSELPKIRERVRKWCAPDISGEKILTPNPAYEAWLSIPPNMKGNSVPPQSHIVTSKSFTPDDNFPVVRDNNGNTFLCVAYGSVMHEYIRKYRLDGGKKAINVVINIQALLGGGYQPQQFRDKLTTMFMPPGQNDAGNWANKDSYDDEFLKYNNNRTPEQLGIPNLFSTERNFFSAMQMIERSNKKYDKTFVFVGIGESETQSAIDTALVSSFLTIANLAFKALGVPLDLITDINKIYSLLQNFSAEPSNLGSIFQLAGMVLPKNYSTYVEKAQTIAAAIQNPDPGSISAAMQAAQTITKQLNGGNMPEWVQWGDKQVNSVYTFAQNQWRVVKDYVNATDEQVAKTVQSYSNYATTLLTGGISDFDNGWSVALQGLVQQGKDVFSDSGSNGSVGLQNIFTTSTKGAALTLLPNAQQLIGGILSNSVLSVKTVTDVAEHAALMAIATGKKYADEQVRGFQLKSLLNKAEDAVRANIPFALPAIWSFADDKDTKEIGECFAREIEVCLNINVCRTPKTMINGICSSPNANTTTTTANNTNIKKRFDVELDLNTTEQPDVTVPLPECIVRLSTGDYFYCPDTKCDSMIWKTLNVISPSQNRDVYTEPTKPTFPDNPTKPTIPLIPTNGNANGGTGYYGDTNDYNTYGVGSSPIPGNDNQYAYYQAMRNGEIGSPQMADPNCNILYPAIYSKGVWYAQISGKYVTITACCPTERPTVTNDCCDATQKNISALAQQIVKLQELVLRNSAGEKTQAVDLSNVMNELNAIHILIDGMRSQKPNEIKQIDISPLQKQINDLQTAVNNIKLTVPVQNGTTVKQYDDAGLRQQITELRSLITQTKSDSERPYDAELILIQNNLTQLKQAYDKNIQMLLNEIRTQGNTPILQTDYTVLLNERNAQVKEYQKRIQELQDRITAQTTTTTPTNPSVPKEPTRVPTRTYDVNGNCTDCPVLEETHTRRIYKYPQQPQTTLPCNSDDC